MRVGAWTGSTAGLAPGFVQANLVIVAQEIADEFERYCRANPEALPLLERTEVGSPVPRRLAADADLRTDLPRYRLYRDGRLLEEPTDIVTLWHKDSVAFLTGCSFSFEHLLRRSGVSIRHTEIGCIVPMYRTNRPTHPIGPFLGPLVVTMRPIRRQDVDRVVKQTGNLPAAHGAPVHIGSPDALGISDLSSPDYGDPVPVRQDEVPVFWACGVTAQAAAEEARVPRMITHAPGHMLITDLSLTDCTSGLR